MSEERGLPPLSGLDKLLRSFPEQAGLYRPNRVGSSPPRPVPLVGEIREAANRPVRNQVQCEAADALELSWLGLEVYAFPPSSLILAVLSEWRRQLPRMSLFAPVWQAQS